MPLVSDSNGNKNNNNNNNNNNNGNITRDNGTARLVKGVRSKSPFETVDTNKDVAKNSP